tara:strand:+ start:447 stop:824 length:378 start_codon:yes stop_codon:yes gene_type:complete
MKIANILSALLGTVLALIALQWIFTPETAAELLNMNYLEGEGRNTQIRDFTAFFLGTAIMSFLSFITKQYQWIFSAGIIFLIAAIFNVLASLNHDATLAISSLISEILFLSMAFIAGVLYKTNKL